MEILAFVITVIVGIFTEGLAVKLNMAGLSPVPNSKNLKSICSKQFSKKVSHFSISETPVTPILLLILQDYFNETSEPSPFCGLPIITIEGADFGHFNQKIIIFECIT